jgi:hypothetical protein
MKNVYEIFEEVAKAASDKDRVLVLRFNSSNVLKNVLQGTFHPAIEYNVTQVPLYKPDKVPAGMGYSHMGIALDRVYLFVKGSTRADPNLSEQRRQQILIQILESLEQKEAEVFMNMLLKKQKVSGLTYKLVKEAFPDLLP